MSLKTRIAYYFLILPLFLHWTLPDGKWEMQFTTIYYGSFCYSWVVVFYLLYYITIPRRGTGSNHRDLKTLFFLGFCTCIFSLLYANNGDYAFELLLSALPFYIVPVILLIKPPSKDFLSVVKWPIFFAFALNLLLYLLSTLWGVSIISRDFEDTGYSLFYRPATFTGGANSSSFFIFILGAFISEIYIKTTIKRILFLAFLLPIVGIGACRGAFLVQTLYLILVILRYLRKGNVLVNTVIFISLAVIFTVADNRGLFNDLKERNKELVGVGELDNGRDIRSTFAINNTLQDSPFIGVGHSRVFSSSKDLLYQYNEKSFKYSYYNVAPHNVYVLAFAEYGFIGLFLFVIGVILVFFKLDYNSNLSFIVVLVALIIMNTEAIMIQDDFWPFLWIIISFCIKSKYNKLRIRK